MFPLGPSVSLQRLLWFYAWREKTQWSVFWELNQKMTRRSHYSVQGFIFHPYYSIEYLTLYLLYIPLQGINLWYVGSQGRDLAFNCFLGKLSTNLVLFTYPFFSIRTSHSKTVVGNLFSAKDHLDIYNISHGAYKIINLKNYPVLFGQRFN